MATFFITSGIRTSIAHRNALLEMEAVLIAAAAIALVVVGALFLFVKYSVVAVVAEPVLGIVAGYVASTAYHYVTERKQRLLIKGMFSTYVNPAVVDELLADPDKLVLGGQRKELTVLFSDIAGFTGVAETLTPEELVGLLNEYMSEMSDVILQNDGTLDKYMGDAVMAFWGAPIPQDDHPVRACRCALTMQRTLAAINEAWTARGRGPIAIRIGINTGEMIVGNMGGSRRFAYTVIGDSVNIASRLEGANKQYGTTVMVAQHTFERVRDVMAGRELDRIAVRGRSEPITVYELLGMKEELRDAMAAEFLEKYAEGIRLYREREWERALALFRAALAIRPHDMPSAMYVERTRICQANPPPASWNGVFVMETK
jgi:adenylate cyclase